MVMLKKLFNRKRFPKRKQYTHFEIVFEEFKKLIESQDIPTLLRLTADFHQKADFHAQSLREGELYFSYAGITFELRLDLDWENTMTLNDATGKVRITQCVSFDNGAVIHFSSFQELKDKFLLFLKEIGIKTLFKKEEEFYFTNRILRDVYYRRENIDREKLISSLKENTNVTRDDQLELQLIYYTLDAFLYFDSLYFVHRFDDSLSFLVETKKYETE